jgi:MFS family permease
MPFYFEIVRGFSPLESGFLLAPQALGVMITLPIAGWIVDHRNPFWLPLASVPLLVTGIVPFALSTNSTSVELLCAANFVLGLGLGLVGMPATTAALQSVPEREIARTSTALSVVNQSGASIGTALFSVLLAAALPASVASGIEALGAGGAGGPAATAAPAVAAAFATTFGWVALALAAIAVPALGLALADDPRSLDPDPCGPAPRHIGGPDAQRAIG